MSLPSKICKAVEMRDHEKPTSVKFQVERTASRESALVIPGSSLQDRILSLLQRDKPAHPAISVVDFLKHR